MPCRAVLPRRVHLYNNTGRGGLPRFTGMLLRPSSAESATARGIRNADLSRLEMFNDMTHLTAARRPRLAASHSSSGIGKPPFGGLVGLSRSSPAPIWAAGHRSRTVSFAVGPLAHAWRNPSRVLKSRRLDGP